MLDSKQITQVFVAAVVAVLALWALSQVAAFVLSHILLISLLTLVLAVAGVWYLSQENAKPRA